MPRSLEQQKRTWRLYDRIVELNNSGLIDREIAKIVGCSEITVSRARRAAGLKKRAPYKGFPSKLTTEAKAWIKQNSANLTNAKIAERYGVKESTAEKWRLSLEARFGHKGVWKRHRHPKGFKGGKHSAQAKKIFSEVSKKMWADPNHFLNSKEYRQKVSDRMSKKAPARNAKNAYSNAKRGKREGLGDYFFRSRWEANYARFLNLAIKQKEIFKWEYEPETFWFERIKRGTRSYTPDFKIWETETSVPYFVEIKGWMDAKSKTKLKRMGKYFPHIRVDLVDEKQYRALEKSIAALISDWEHK